VEKGGLPQRLTSDRVKREEGRGSVLGGTGGPGNDGRKEIRFLGFKKD